MSYVIAIVLIVAVSLTIIILLIWKNKKDKKLLNPGSQDSVDEAMMDHSRGRDRI